MPNDTEQTPQEKAHLKQTVYATKPTRITTFLRTFLPWQLWRFASINLKMLVLIRRSHQSHLEPDVRAGQAKSAKAALV